MVQQTIDSKFSEYGLGSTETNFSTRDKQFPFSAKKTVLRDVQNENRIHNSVGNSPLSKDRGQTMDDVKVSGNKRPSPEVPVSPPAPVSRYQPPSSNAANAHLVYVRRKPEAETGKSSTCDIKSISSDCLNSRQLAHPEESTQLNTQIKEPKVSSFPALAPMPAASLMSASGKPSVPLGQSTTRFAAEESNYHPVASAPPSSHNPKGKKSLHWEERYRQLLILLKKLDESDQEEYVQMLRSLSSVELSRHAVELEKRSIQLSLEEAKEVQRVGALNVLGKSMKNFKAPSTHQSQSEK